MKILAKLFTAQLALSHIQKNNFRITVHYCDQYAGKGSKQPAKWEELQSWMMQTSYQHTQYADIEDQKSLDHLSQIPWSSVRLKHRP